MIERAESLNRGYFSRGRMVTLANLLAVSPQRASNCLSGRGDSSLAKKITLWLLKTDKDFIADAAKIGVEIKSQGDHYTYSEFPKGIHPELLALINKACAITGKRFNSKSFKCVSSDKAAIKKLLGTEVRARKEPTNRQIAQIQKFNEMSHSELKNALLNAGVIDGNS